MYTAGSSTYSICENIIIIVILFDFINEEAHDLEHLILRCALYRTRDLAAQFAQWNRFISYIASFRICLYMHGISRWSIGNVYRDDIATETTTPRRRFYCNCKHIYRPHRNNEIRLPWIELRVASSGDKRMIHLYTGTMQVIASRCVGSIEKERDAEY